MTEEFNKSNFIAAFIGIYLFSVAVGVVVHFNILFEYQDKVERETNHAVELEHLLGSCQESVGIWRATTMEYVEKYDALLAAEPTVTYYDTGPSYEERQLIKAQTEAQKSMREYLDAERRRKILAGVAPTPIPYNPWDKRYEMPPNLIDQNIHLPGCACAACLMGPARVVHGSACPCSICVNQFNRRID